MTTPRLLATLVLAGSVLAACGGDDDSDTAATTQPASQSTEASASESTATTETASATTEAPSAAIDPPDATEAPPATEPAATAAPTGDRFTDCPDAADLAPHYGSELALVEDQAMTGAIGLVFCPYTEVLAPGTTNAFGGEKIPDEFSITFTDQNVVVPGDGEEIPGLGESASWSGSDLSVWMGDQGMIVSIVFDPPAGDAKMVSVAIAQEVLA